MIKRVIQYKDVHDSYATWYAGNSNLVYRFYPDQCGLYCVKGKDAYLDSKNSYYDPPTVICNNARFGTQAGLNQKLFVSSSSKIPRDLIRNSGYKIVMDKYKADYVVVPKTDKISCSQYSFNIAFKLTDGDAYFVRVHRNDGVTTYYDSERDIIIDTIKNEVKNVGKEIEDIFYDSDLASFKVYFMPKCEEYREIYLDPKKYDYVLDDTVELQGATDISIETLEIWRRMDSEQVFQKSVLNSNWKQYPCTLAVFLTSEKDDFCYKPTGQWAWLLSQIHYSAFEHDITCAEMVTSPEDWNMLQKWIMHRLDVSDNGGYVRFEDFDKCPYDYKKLLSSRMYVRPVFVQDEATFKNLLAKAKDI